MGLRVTQSISGRPASCYQAISTCIVAQRRLLALATDDRIDLLCASEFSLQRSVLFSDAFPNAASRPISAVLLSVEGKLIASAGNDVAIWERRNSEWHVHSSLQTGSAVNCLAYSSGSLIVGSDLISLWKLDEASRLPLWTKRWSDETYGSLLQVVLSKDGRLLAAVAKQSPVVQIWSIEGDKVKRSSEAWHPANVDSISWKDDSSALFTQTDNGIFRIWSAMIDEPDYFVLWATVNHSPFAGVPRGPRALVSYWIEADALGANTSNACDSVLTVFADGSVGVASVQNVGRVPPTCVVQHFTITCLKALTRGQVAALRYSHLIIDQEARTFQLVGHSAKGSLLSVVFPSLSARPRCVEYGSRAAAPFVSLASAARDEDAIWSLCADGTVTLHAGDTLVSLASRCVVDANLLCAIDASAVVVSAKSEIVWLHRQGKSLFIRASCTLDSPLLDMRKQNTCTVTGLTIAGVTLTFRVREDQLDQIARTEPPSKARVCALLADGVATLDEQGVFATASRGRIKTNQSGPSAWSFSDNGHLAVATCSGADSFLTIWDTIESEFSTGRVFQERMSEPINSLHWLDAGAEVDVLAARLVSTVVVVSRFRRPYLAEQSAWSIVEQQSVKSITSIPLSAMTWRPSGEIVVAAGSALFTLGSASKVLQQAMIAGKSLAVDRILLAFYKQLRAYASSGQEKPWLFDADISLLLSHSEAADARPAASRSVNADLVVGLQNGFSWDVEAEELDESVVHELQSLMVDYRDAVGLDGAEAAQLCALARTAHDIKAHRRAIDMNGMRYLSALRASAASSGPLVHLHFRDMVWAYHSQTQEILLQASVDAHQGKMTWQQAKALGIFQWLRNSEALGQHMELVARTTYNATEDRDPVSCLIFYLALRKRRIAYGLWKQAVGHPDRTNMLKFLINNFDEPRWQTSARKNAFSLLSKQRFELAAAFFLLGDSLSDAVNVCLRQLGDFQLAIAVARVYEGCDRGPVLRRILESHVVPLALGEGHRWLASWAFWMLNRRDLAVRAIVTPFSDLLSSLPMPIKHIGEPNTDDPALVVLLAELRDRSLQTLQGASYISGKTEFNFVLYMARILREMGCHVLALDLVSTWPFAEPPRSPKLSRTATLSNGDTVQRPLARRRSSVLQRKQSSIIADIPSTVVSRAASPEPEPMLQRRDSTEDEQREAIARLARLNKKAVKDVAAFDMSAFGF